MAYKTMEEQIASHLEFLKQHHFVVEELSIDRGFIRCCSSGDMTGRGEFCYQTRKNQLRNGLVGLATWARSAKGEVKTHKTYGEDFPDEQQPKLKSTASTTNDLEKIESFWQLSNEIGESEYLLKKGVGYYGLRFRNNEYGKVVIVPMRDITGGLWSYQIINPDGSKRYARDSLTKLGLHMLHKPINKFPIGVAESYVTAATCFELTGMAMITAFSADNLLPVSLILRKKFPDSTITIFGDNDRHLQKNKGKIAAEDVKNELRKDCRVLTPPFENSPCRRDFSDWNDLVREIGVYETRKIISHMLSQLCS